jgi:hypothetical protein
MNTPPFSRRHMLTTKSSGIGWLAFSALAQGEAGLTSKTTHFAARAKRMIFLTMRGRLSHVDLFDYMPELPKRDRQPLPRHSGPAPQSISF